MLSKLFKHELKATARLLLPIYLVLVVLTIMDRIALNLDIFHGVLSIIPGLITMAYVISLVAIVIVSFVIIIMRFYKNLMTDEGYLMFTLPVKSHQLITSKLLTSILWTVASVVAVIASLFAVFATSDTWGMIVDVYKMAMVEIEAELGGFTTILFIELILLIIFSLINGILEIYAAIAIGQLFNGHKVIGSFAAYIGITTVIQIIASVFLFIAGMLFKQRIDDIEAIPQLVFPITILFLLVFNVTFYWITNYIFKRKLNLE
jgi:hypothetical protein